MTELPLLFTPPLVSQSLPKTPCHTLFLSEFLAWTVATTRDGLYPTLWTHLHMVRSCAMPHGGHMIGWSSTLLHHLALLCLYLINFNHNLKLPSIYSCLYLKKLQLPCLAVPCHNIQKRPQKCLGEVKWDWKSWNIGIENFQWHISSKLLCQWHIISSSNPSQHKSKHRSQLKNIICRVIGITA